MNLITKNKLDKILKKSKYSINSENDDPKPKDKFKIIIEVEMKEVGMNNKMPEWFKIWNENTFIPFKNQVEERLDKLEKDVVELKKDVSELKKDVAAIKNCPTIKRELNLK